MTDPTDKPSRLAYVCFTIFEWRLPGLLVKLKRILPGVRINVFTQDELSVPGAKGEFPAGETLDEPSKKKLH
jgi:hypothetical protein